MAMYDKLVEDAKKLIPSDAATKLDVAEKIHHAFSRITPSKANISVNDILEKYFFVLYPSLLATEQDTISCTDNTRIVIFSKLFDYAQLKPQNLEHLLKIQNIIENNDSPYEKINIYSILSACYSTPIHKISPFMYLSDHNPQVDNFFENLPLILKNTFKTIDIYIRSATLIDKNQITQHKDYEYYNLQLYWIKDNFMSMISNLSKLAAAHTIKTKTSSFLKEIITTTNLQQLNLAAKLFLNDAITTKNSLEFSLAAKLFLNDAITTKNSLEFSLAKKFKEQHIEAATFLFKTFPETIIQLDSRSQIYAIEKANNPKITPITELPPDDIDPQMIKDFDSKVKKALSGFDKLIK